ncbi:SCO6745 family protein [Kitasatospora sp. HPMI-4]|uniref:SCO6745 family protein n=1 Tax=Kitasatospora sp. HPMI-4 TaxID=3448443 RepID=UPI003F1B10DD
MEPSPTLARRLWEAIEPIHAVAYFAPEPAEASRAIGLVGFWMGYFAGRIAPVGPLRAPAANALCFAFAPARVARALPDAWAYATPEKVLDVRLSAVRAALERSLPPTGRADLERLVALLERAVEGCGYEGRTLAAAWSAVPRPGDLVGRLWLAATVLREHRGDGHVIAVAHAGLTGLEATLTHVATGRLSRELLQTSRGWSDTEWEQARRRLTGRGLLDRDSRLTRGGGTLRREIEHATDRLAGDPVTLLGTTGVEEAIRLAAPLSRHLVDTGVVPVPNPIGAPRP